MILLSQKNQIYDLIESKSLSPSLFTVEQSSIDITFKYQKTDFFYSIIPRADGWLIKFSPGDSRLSSAFGLSTWSDVLNNCSFWIQCLKREITAIDKWKRLENEVQQISITYTNEADKFSAAEYEELKIRMLVFKQKIQQLGLSPEEIGVLENKIDHLTELAKDLGKFDWKGLFVGSIVGVIMQLSVTPENANELWRIIREVFNTYFIASN